MDRQPLTDRLGDRLLAEYGGAAAAYSLRALNGNGDNVVRVRRASDNDEKDFTAGEVTNGNLVDFCNNGTSDLYSQRMYFDGVDDYVTLTSSFTLSSGSGFSLSGTIIPMIEGIGDGLFGDTSAPNTGFWLGTNGAVALTDDAGTFSIITPAGVFEKGEIQEFTIFENGSGNWAITVNGVTTNTTRAVTDVTIDRIGLSRSRLLKGTIYDISYSLNGTPVYSYLGYDNTNGGWEDQVASNDGTVNGSPSLYTGQPFDGFVETWYDQTGNGNDATQSVAGNQPKIVENGTYLGKLKFDGVDDLLTADGAASAFNGTDPDISAFIVNENTQLDSASFSLGSSSASIPSLLMRTTSLLSPPRWQLRIADNSNTVADIKGATAVVDTEYLTSFFTGGGSQSQFVNGAAKGTASVTFGTCTFNRFTIGVWRRNSLSNYHDGPIREVIIYASDQTDNRTAIEGNINAHYSIYP